MNTLDVEPNSAQLTGRNGAWSNRQCHPPKITVTVLVRMIPNVSRKAALKLNAQQLARSATIRFCRNLFGFGGFRQPNEAKGVSHEARG